MLQTFRITVGLQGITQNGSFFACWVHKMFLCSWDSLWCLVCLFFSLYWWANILVLLFWCRLFPGPTPYFNSIIGEWVEAKKLIKSPFAAGEFLRCFLQLKFWGFFFNIVIRNPHLVPHCLILKKPWVRLALVRERRMPGRQRGGFTEVHGYVQCAGIMSSNGHTGMAGSWQLCVKFICLQVWIEIWRTLVSELDSLHWDGCRGFLGY